VKTKITNQLFQNCALTITMSLSPHCHSNDDKSTNHNSIIPPPYSVVKCTDVPQYEALQNAAAEFLFDEKLHLRYLCNDTARCNGLTALLVSYTYAATGKVPMIGPVAPPVIRKIILDYSRQQVTGETMELLFDLADAVYLSDRREAFRTGERINVTENKPVLHHFLRKPPSSSNDNAGVPPQFHRQSSTKSNNHRPRINSSNHHRRNNTSSNTMILEEIHAVRRQIAAFSQQVRSGDYQGITGLPFKDTVVVSADGSGGMHLATQWVHRALMAHPASSKAASGRRLHFLSNIDPVDTYFTTHDLNPATTLVVLVAKELFSTGDGVGAAVAATSSPPNELLHWKSIRNWLVSNLQRAPTTVALGISEAMILERHSVAVTCPPGKRVTTTADPQLIGISKLFPIWDWVIGRFSVCSAAGMLPLSLQYGYNVMSEFLDGAHDMDQHFFNAPLRDNIPVLLGLLGVWNSTFLGYTTRAILPFSEALDMFPSYVQLVDMESNGKRVALDGVELLHPSGEIDFGEVAGNSHHPFYQLMHHGRVVPADFIGFMESPRPMDLPGEAVSSHDEFMSNFFAQPDALAYGKSLVDLIQEGVPDGLREHMVFPGNRPSSSILLTRLDPFSMGQLLALYEHRTAVQGFLWGINSFDQFGLEMGKLLAKYIRVQLAASRRTGATVQGFNQSTSSLLEAYLNHGKSQAKSTP
jgi:glucose-6-phosphate isomerase